MKRIIPLLFILALAVFPSLGQMKKKDAKNLLIKGDNLIRSNNYKKAHHIFTQLTSEFPNDKLYEYRLGICDIHIHGKEKEGLEHLLNVKSLQGGENYGDYTFHLAEAYYYNHQFEEAKPLFEKYLVMISEKEKKDPLLVQHVRLRANYNQNAFVLGADSTRLIRVDNLSYPVNTVGEEYAPYVTPDESTIFYTYRGEKSTGGKMNPNFKPDTKNGRYFEDILVAHRDQYGAWDTPKAVEGINTLSNDACVGTSQGGDQIFVYKNIGVDNSDIFESFLQEDSTWSEPKSLKGAVNSKYWEGSASVTSDGKTLYFSSERIGGYGGRDLYKAQKLRDGTWGKVRNLGPKINSEFDEDAPYIHPDDVTLFFSSNGIRSMGGYDVMYAELQEDGSWHNITNAGIPINTLDDDRFYILSADGQTGYFSRANGTEADDQDLFIATPGKLGNPPVLALITGKVFLDNQTKPATIKVRDPETGEVVGTYKTKPGSQLFTMMLKPKKDYLIDVEIDGKLAYSDSLNAEFVDRFIKLKHDYHVYSDDYKGEKAILNFSLQEKVQKVYNQATGAVEIDTNFVLESAIITTKNDTVTIKDLNKIIKQNKIDFYRTHKDIAEKDHVTEEILARAEETEIIPENQRYNAENGFKGNENKYVNTKEEQELAEVFHPSFTKHELVYRVQVAAYRKPENYRWSGHNTFGDILELTYGDGITRFTIGGTKYLEEAESLRKRLVDFGVEDAFIVGFRGENRIPLTELLSQNKQ